VILDQFLIQKFILNSKTDSDRYSP